MSGRNWVCDVCRSNNSSNAAICSVCHQPRTITPITGTPRFDGSIMNDKMEVTVDMTSQKSVEKHHKSRHNGRKESRHRHRNDSPVSQPSQGGESMKMAATASVAPMSLKPSKSSRRVTKKPMVVSGNVFEEVGLEQT